jgi:hypothetical protein
LEKGENRVTRILHRMPYDDEEEQALATLFGAASASAPASVPNLSTSSPQGQNQVRRVHELGRFVEVDGDGGRGGTGASTYIDCVGLTREIVGTQTYLEWHTLEALRQAALSRCRGNGRDQQQEESSLVVAADMVVLPALELEEKARMIIAALGHNYSSVVIDDGMKGGVLGSHISQGTISPSASLFVAGLAITDCHTNDANGGLLTSLQHFLSSDRLECIPNGQDDGTYR